MQYKMKLKRDKKMSNKKISNLMLQTNFICNLLYSATYPYIYYQTMQQITDTYISADNIISCVAIIIFGFAWNKKYGDVLFKHYRLFCVVETILDIVYIAITIVTNNLRFYYVSGSIVMALVTQNIIFGGTRLRAKVHPSEKEREQYDNNRDIVNAGAVLVGNAISILTNVDIKILLIIACLGNVIDNVAYYYIWTLMSKNKDESR